MPFKFKNLEIPEVILIKPTVFTDERGFFAETYKKSDFLDFGIKEEFLQENHSLSKTKGVLRGLHFQIPPKAQAKLVRVISGSVFDVALDIRKNSPTFGSWVSAVLSGENKDMLYVPEGFAHGFCTLEENTEVIYKCSRVYSPGHDRGIIWNDPALAIPWPVENPILSEKDKVWPLLKDTGDIF
ncbi:MAG: dTDP-4-dehydrorhamnose 3,5-epimerase [Dehalococcoidia bacterium]|nr:MAG: dTDP-4-dehydrorhamnose 3,5-epimerase [Dehalococcoidia bacterium]